MGRSFRIDGTAFLMAAVAILLLPLNWIAAAVSAAAIHEAFHYTAARLMKVPVYGLFVDWRGCRMDTGPMERKQELICAAAGPAGSLELLFLLRWFPRLALCGAVQGIYNLLPVEPLDGGRILRCTAGERVLAAAALMAVGGSVILGVAAWLFWDLGPLPLIFGIVTAGRYRKLKNSLQTGQTRSTIELPIFKR